MRRETPDFAGMAPYSARLTRPSRNIRSTVNRGFHGADHQPPNGKHANGRGSAVWHGHRRVLDPGALRRANARTWRKVVARERRTITTLAGETS